VLPVLQAHKYEFVCQDVVRLVDLHGIPPKQRLAKIIFSHGRCTRCLLKLLDF
jgi:hypothetical protein